MKSNFLNLILRINDCPRELYNCPIYYYRNVCLGVVCMQITATLVFSVFDFILGIAELTISAIGLSNDLYCQDYPPYDNYCSDWVIILL